MAFIDDKKPVIAYLYDLNGNPLIFLAEDAAHASGDRGIMALGVRKDTAAALAGADGDYAPLEIDANGRLHVNLSNVQLDDTDKLAVSLYIKDSAAGDVPVKGITAGAINLNHLYQRDSALPTLDAAANDNVTSQDSPPILARGTLLNSSSKWDRARSIAASGAGLGVTQVGTLGELITLAASAARTDSANGTAVTGLGWRNRYIILFDLTVADTDAGDTLNVFIDVSLDGTTWLNAVHFTEIIGTDAASKRFAVLDPSAPGTAEILVTSDAAAAAVRPSLFGAQMRARWAIVDAGTDDASFTFSIVAYAI